MNDVMYGVHYFLGLIEGQAGDWWAAYIGQVSGLLKVVAGFAVAFMVIRKLERMNRGLMERDWGRYHAKKAQTETFLKQFKRTCQRKGRMDMYGQYEARMKGRLRDERRAINRRYSRSRRRW